MDATTDMEKAGRAATALDATTRVALVEDEPLVREMVHAFLEEAGYDVTSGGAAEDILAGWAAQPADILLTDVTLPGLTGVELALALRTHSPHLKVVYMSGNVRDPAARQSVGSLDTKFLAKPFSRSMLLEVIRSVSADVAA